jgi:lipopolysaccharide/colanic/teichoic acid biosynthesis glycosyltransferase
MNMSRLFWLTLPERFLAFLFLVVLLPFLLFLAFLIHSTSGDPILVKDDYTNASGKLVGVMRFRIAGSEVSIMKKYSIDYFPAFLNVVHGDVRFKELFDITKRRA